MSKEKCKVFFFASAVCFALLAISVLLFYPASWLFLNKSSRALRYVAGILFWASLVLGIVLQVISRFISRAEKKNARLKRKQEGSSVKTILFRTPLSVVLLLIAFVGIIGSAVCMSITMVSYLRTFVFLSMAVFGIIEYLIFNSSYYTFLVKRSDNRVE